SEKACGLSNEDQIPELTKSSGTTSLNYIVVNEDHISAVDGLKGSEKACGLSNEDQIPELAKSSGTTSLNNIVVNEDNIFAVDDLEVGSEKACEISIEDQSLTIPDATEFGIEEKDPIKIIASGPFSYEKRKLILSWGPHQPQKEDMSKNGFPVRNNRSFLPSCTDCIFCLYCILIGNDKQSVWVTTGFGTWSKATQRLIMHETSSFHVEASLKLKLEDQCVPLQPSILKARNTFVATNRLIVAAIIDVILYLVQHSLALRGHRENWESNLRGNFKDLVCLLGKRQNELIDAMAGYTRGVILKQIKYAKFFSITLDSTFDNSRKEQLSFVIRYIHDETA
ncbi:zinc finger MYM-type protein 1-like, partial [Aphis craccivora]